MRRFISGFWELKMGIRFKVSVLRSYSTRNLTAVTQHPTPNVFMANFKDLKVWERAKNLAVFIYQLTEKGKIQKDFTMKDQMRRAVVSISSNIAEGEQLGSNQQSIKHFYLARGSSAELLSQAIIAHQIAYFTEDELNWIEKECSEINSMLTRLIQTRS